MPVLSKNWVSILVISPTFEWQAGGNAARFLNNLGVYIIFPKFGLKNRTKCCPFFSINAGSTLVFPNLGDKQEQMLFGS